MRRMVTGLLLRVLFLCIAVSAQYYGRLISNGWEGGTSHSLAGDVYAIDSTNIQIIGFTFNSSQSPACSDARFYGVNKLDDSLEELTNPDGLQAAISDYTSQDVTVPLQSKSLADYKAIGVYCSDNSPPTRLGIATFPNGFAAPAPQVIGQFTRRAHRVRSGDVTVLNNRMIKIEDFNYDGQGPDAYFYVGISESVALAPAPYGKIPDENGIDSRKATAYSDRTIILLLPEDISAVDLKWLSMYCISYEHNFGEVFFPDDLNVPPYQEVEIDRQGLNCEPMNDRYQVAWSVDGDMINFELAGLIDRETEYMSFGLSGSDDAFSMIGADVVVADFLSDSMPRAVDYYLTAYSQCAPNGGACPDDSTYNSAVDDVEMPTARFTNGILRISYQRKLNTSDTNKDKVYMTDGTEQQVVWAIGPLNTNKETAKHYAPPRGRISANKAINFGRDPPVDNCPAFTLEPEEEKPKFVGDHIYGDEDKKVFTVEIGQAGSEQGYKAITGLPSWGIAWYVDNKLVPELHLKRGVTYTFKVRGGTDPADGSMYHPWYITDSVEGGYGQDPQDANIYKGMVNGAPVDYATGAYCEWKLSDAAVKKADEGFVYQCFQELRNDLNLDCVSGEGTDFEWTPDSTVPDTVYYQCYTHKNLGWKINLYDELPSKKDRTFAPDCTGGSVTSSTVSTVTSSPAPSVTSSPAPSVTNKPETNGTSGQTTAADRNLITLMVSQSTADNDIVKGSCAALIPLPTMIGAVIAIMYL